MSTTTTTDLDTSIITAVFQGNLTKTMEIILSNPELVNKMFDFSILPINRSEKIRGTLLHLLCRDGFCHSYCDEAHKNMIPIADFLIYKGAKLNILDSCGLSVLYRAISSNHGSIITFLIEKGADVEELSKGFTPLTWACYKHHVTSVKLLLEKGANPNHLISGKHSSLFFACTSDSFQVETVKLLLDSGANPQLGVSPLFAEPASLPCKTIRCESVEMMLKHGLNINQTENGISSLFALIRTGNTPVLRILLNMPGVVSTCKNADGQTPAQVVAKLLCSVQLPTPPTQQMSSECFLMWTKEYAEKKKWMEEWAAILQLCLK
jgi:ankyrin repeat protein